jgi:DnaJ-class molecular chaperone
MMGANIEIDVEAIMDELDHKCWNCNGSGQSKTPSPVGCEFCNGVGYQTSAAGDALIMFIKRHRNEIANDK